MARGRRGHDRAPSPYPRTARVNQVLREVVAEALERLSDIDDRLRLITVTSVDTTPDLSRATVYLSSLSDEAAAALADQRVSLQRQIGRQVRLKRTPLLEFVADPAVAHGFQVEEILRRLQRSTPPESPGSGSGEDDDGGR
ncbi:MAG TPA: 30S ribosome-binding factor RbfA [Acidimicrobiales bacterium]|nr:30S ribosome-binding factor RbfA [Acidimicrobiales bacterium]